MKRLLVLVYSIGVYIFAVFAILYLVAFIAGFNVPGIRVDTSSILLNTGLLVLFGLQHSLMARDGFKRRLVQILPQEVERSTYVLAASVVTVVLVAFWQPMPGIVWHVGSDAGQVIVQVAFWFGIVLVIASTFAISHLDFFGLRQGILAWLRQPHTEPVFQMPVLYRLVRHPMMTGMLIAFWAVPELTVGRLLFAVGMTIYILIGTRFEERNLERQFGKQYVLYQQRTPAFFPRLRFRKTHPERSPRSSEA